MLHNLDLILTRRSSDRNLTDESVEKPKETADTHGAPHGTAGQAR